MPASRSRTERWRDVLSQIAQRGGGLEFAVAPPEGGAGATRTDLMWRVRLLRVGEADLLLEHPSAAGASMPIEPGTPVVVAMSVGQNRWMFHSRVLTAVASREGRPGSLRLAMPEHVERCFRRDFTRVSTAELHLPKVECWQLLEPASVPAAEAANREAIRGVHEGLRHPAMGGDELPIVGPKFGASLVNIGGGGVGLMVGREEATAAGGIKLLWMRINLTPQIGAPLGVTAKQVHTHLDSGQNLYVGLAFEFGFNPSHRAFVVEQITRYVNLVQAARKAA